MNETPPAAPPGADAPVDENRLIHERRQKLTEWRAAGHAYPNDFRRNALAKIWDRIRQFAEDPISSRAKDAKLAKENPF